jgi:16S rRNA (cytosine1402-N4)-methyltransferase
MKQAKRTTRRQGSSPSGQPRQGHVEANGEKDRRHQPILVNAVADALRLRPGDRCIDATINGGGHASVLLQRTAPDGKLLGIDRDGEVLERARRHLAAPLAAGRLHLAQQSFTNLAGIAAERGFTAVRGIVFDLGMSSHHLDASGRGFAFSREEPLDMRFDPGDPSCPTAAQILRRSRAEELARIFRDYGEERFARRIAAVIVERRQQHPILTTSGLLDVIRAALPARVRWRADRSAARVFQALRIAVNGELEAIGEALPQAIALLAPEGRLAVLSFHSLEDRLVKHFFRSEHEAGRVHIVTRKPLRPDADEIARNPRSASAKLRLCERRE